MIGYGYSYFVSTILDTESGTAPVNTVAPVISGGTSVGSTLTTTNGTWTGTPVISYTYQWYRGVSQIVGATNSTYLLVAADVSNSIKCRVTATNAFGSANADSNSITATWESDAQAFITAASITDPTQQSAINQLVVDLKGYGIWTKMKALYPFVGGTSSTHKWNLKDPRDLDAAFRILWNGGVTHSANGVLFGGVNGYGDTKLIENTSLNSNDSHISIYSRTNVSGVQCDIGAANSSTQSNIFPNLSGVFYPRVQASNSGTAVSLNTQGLFIANRVNSTQVQGWRNTTKYTISSNSTGKVTVPFWLGDLNNNGVSGVVNSTKQLAFASIGDGLTDTEAANFYTAVQTFQTTLGRQVGTPIPLTGNLLNDYPDAAAAYSLRKLSSTYTGNAIRVRRSSDNAEQNIGFVNNVLDTASLLTFCGAGNGFVTTWYDQSGNSRNATNTIALQQPQIVSSGVVLLTNGKPSIKFNNANSNNLLYNSNLFLGANSRTILSVYKPNNSSGTFSYGIFGQSGSTNAGSWTVLQSRTQFVTGDPYFAGYSADLGNGLSTPNTSQKLAQFNYNGTTGYLYKNNSLLTSSNITLNALNTGQIYIGTSFSGTAQEYALADIQECIAWGSNQDSNTSGISNNINTFYTIY